MKRYDDHRWGSPAALIAPRRPTPFCTVKHLEGIRQWLCEVNWAVTVPVYPDGEIVSDEFVTMLQVLMAHGVQFVRTHVVWIDSREDIDFYSSIGIDVVEDAHPTLRAELMALTDRSAPRPIKSGRPRAWWFAAPDEGSDFLPDAMASLSTTTSLARRRRFGERLPVRTGGRRHAPRTRRPCRG